MPATPEPIVPTYKFKDPLGPYNAVYLCKRHPTKVTLSKAQHNQRVNFDLPLEEWGRVASSIPTGEDGVDGAEYRWKPDPYTMWVFRFDKPGEKASVRIIAYAQGTNIDITVPIKIWRDIVDFMSLIPESERTDRMRLLRED